MYEYFIKPIKNGYLVEVTVKLPRLPDADMARIGQEGEYYCEDFKAVIALVAKVEKK